MFTFCTFTQIIKTLLVPTLEITAIGAVAAISTSCGSEKKDSIHVTDVTLNKLSTTLFIDDTETLIPTVLPEYATDKSVAWTSSDTNVATVDSNGTITAVGLGNAAITVTTHDGGYTATCDVDVIIKQYVCVEANADSTLTLYNVEGNNPDLQYSMDGGASWNTVSTDTYSWAIHIDRDQTLYLKGNNPDGWSYSNTKYSHFTITGDVYLSGNVMGLVDNGTNTKFYIPCGYCFYDLFFESTGITSISKNFLPAKNLASYCYWQMFYGCSSLTTAPELPATTLADSCYESMFQNCSSLTTAPNLSVTTLSDGCYYAMFYGCTSLTTAPNLPATELAEGCYAWMFSNCTSLIVAPNLISKNLVNECYNFIFFYCTSLATIKISYTGEYNDEYFNSWVNSVAESGTFYYNGDQTAQDFGLPIGWATQPIN